MSNEKYSFGSFQLFLRSVWTRITEASVLFWIMLGVFPVFLMYYIRPIYFNDQLKFYYPVDYIYQINPIGYDFRLLLYSLESWFLLGKTTEYVFAPLVLYVFAPFLLIKYPVAYFVITILTIIGFMVTAWLGARIVGKTHHTVVVFVFTLTFFSYGLQFELERGQTYTLAFLPAFWSLYIFYKHRRLRWLAYLLFCISVQMKFSPILLTVLFVDNWREWKSNLIRFAGLALSNVLLLFLMGFSYASAFFSHMGQRLDIAEVWMANHSIKSFTAQLPKMGIAKLGNEAVEWAANHAASIEYFLYGCFLFGLAVILYRTWQRSPRGLPADLLLVCIIGTLILPSVNHDYTLPIVTAPFILAVIAWRERTYPWPALVTGFLIAIASAAYAIILLPAVAKPAYFDNALAPLFIILGVATLFNLPFAKPPISQEEGKLVS